MTHVRQFSQWGIDEFAWRYVRSFGNEIEREADAQGNIVVSGAAPFRSRTPGVGAFGFLNASVVGGPMLNLPTEVLEFFTPQCFFPYQPYIAYFLITNTNRIIMVDPMGGTWLQVDGQPLLDFREWLGLSIHLTGHMQLCPTDLSGALRPLQVNLFQLGTQ